MMDFMFSVIILLLVVGFLSPLFIFKMTLKFNELTKFGVLLYFSLIFVCLCTYLHLFNEKIFENVGLCFEIICGVSYLICIVFIVFPVKIYIEEKSRK